MRMDFGGAQVADGRKSTSLTVIELFSREYLGIEAGFSLQEPVVAAINATVQSCSGKFREECLHAHGFESIDAAKEKIDAWRWDY